jgi:hypothetical protein
LNENVDDATYFADRSSLKITGIGTIKLKLPRFPYICVHNVPYLLELHRNLLSLVHIKHQSHYIHIFDGKDEVRSFDNMVIVTGWEDDGLFKMKGAYALAHNFVYLSHHDEGTLSLSLIWHA